MVWGGWVKKKIWANMLVFWCLNIEINLKNSLTLSFLELRNKFGQASNRSWLSEDTIASNLVTSVTSNLIASKCPLGVESGNSFVRMKGICSNGSSIGS